MIEARGLTKRYGDKVAVDDLSFTVRPGRVTGFLGPNGAGKTTTMRMILGLDRPAAGSVTVNGKPYAELYSAMRPRRHRSAWPEWLLPTVAELYGPTAEEARHESRERPRRPSTTSCGGQRD